MNGVNSVEQRLFELYILQLSGRRTGPVNPGILADSRFCQDPVPRTQCLGPFVNCAADLDT